MDQSRSRSRSQSSSESYSREQERNSSRRKVSAEIDSPQRKRKAFHNDRSSRNSKTDRTRGRSSDKYSASSRIRGLDDRDFHASVDKSQTYPRGSDREDKNDSPNERKYGNVKKKPRDFSQLVKSGSNSADKFQWGKEEKEKEENQEKKPAEKPNFALSGALAKDATTGNLQNGVVMKWSEPVEARIPDKRWRLYVFKNDENIATFHVHRQSAYLFGREKDIADIHIEHPSASKQHAVLQFRFFEKDSEDGLSSVHEIKPYVMDLKSTNGTFLNDRRIEDSRYIELRPKDVLKFGGSNREYVLLSAT